MICVVCLDAIDTDNDTFRALTTGPLAVGVHEQCNAARMRPTPTHCHIPAVHTAAHTRDETR